MGKFLAKRFLLILFSLFTISIVLFALFENMPGDPVVRLLADRMDQLTPDELRDEEAAIRAMLGLDGPIVFQYTRWIGRMVTGDWGMSLHFRRPVLEVIATPIRWTIVLNLIAISIGFLITIPLGIFSAIKRGKAFDNATMVFTVLGFSMPTFLIAIIFIVIFAVFWQVLPIAGMTTAIPPDTTWLRFLDRLRHMALPLMTITFAGLATMTRFVRAAMCDALTEDYVRTARSKGLKEKVVVFSHAFRNALVPVVTLMAGTLLTMFSGSVVIERTFAWSGMGVVMIDSIFRGDYNVVMAMQVFYAAVALLSILLMDIAYGLVDPRIKIAR